MSLRVCSVVIRSWCREVVEPWLYLSEPPDDQAETRSSTAPRHQATTCAIPTASYFLTSGHTTKNAVLYLPTLRLFFEGGVSNDYRLRGDAVEFRTNQGSWRKLDESDLAIHFRFNTEVARWLLRLSLEVNPYNRKIR